MMDGRENVLPSAGVATCEVWGESVHFSMMDGRENVIPSGGVAACEVWGKFKKSPPLGVTQGRTGF